MLRREWHRRADLQDIVVEPDAADQHAALAHEIDEPFGLRRRGGLGLAIADQLDREEHPGAAHIPDEHVPVREFLKLRQRIAAYGDGILQQALVLDHIEDCRADRGGDWVTAERIEIHVPARKRGDEVAARDHCRQRVTVAHGLAF